jgi:hypothetical protein
VKRAIEALACILVASTVVFATTHVVDWSGGGDYLTIQEGIDAASDGDVVLVKPGTYTGANNRNLTFGYKNLTVESEAGLGSTTIDCEGVDRAFYLYDTGQDTTTVIRGFWIRNGYTDNYDGGGLMFRYVGAIVEDCLVSDCVASHNGGGLSIGYNTVPVKVRNCVFERNTATYRGGGANVDHGSAYIRTCLFRDNRTFNTGQDFYGGGALHLNWIDGSPNYRCGVSRCTFVNNSSPGNGTAILAHESVIWAYVSRCIIAFNQGPTYGFYSDPMFESLTFCNLYGNEGGDIEPGYSTLVDGDPRFCNLAGGDVSLCSNSVCLPANNIYTALIGFADQGCGNCSTAVEDASWGRIKALYR